MLIQSPTIEEEKKKSLATNDTPCEFPHCSYLTTNLSLTLSMFSWLTDANTTHTFAKLILYDSAVY